MFLNGKQASTGLEDIFSHPAKMPVSVPIAFGTSL